MVRLSELQTPNPIDCNNFGRGFQQDTLAILYPALKAVPHKHRIPAENCLYGSDHPNLLKNHIR